MKHPKDFYRKVEPDSASSLTGALTTAVIATVGPVEPVYVPKDHDIDDPDRPEDTRKLDWRDWLAITSFVITVGEKFIQIMGSLFRSPQRVA